MSGSVLRCWRAASQVAVPRGRQGQGGGAKLGPGAGDTVRVGVGAGGTARPLYVGACSEFFSILKLV